MPKLHHPSAMIRTLILVIAFFMPAGLAMATQETAPEGASRELTLGVLAYRGLDEVRLRWQPLADYLEGNVPGIRVRVRPLLRNEAEGGAGSW